MISKSPPSLRFARFGWRFLAWCIDQLALAPLFALLWWDTTYGAAIMLLLRAIYYIAAETSRYQGTVGKYFCHLAVTDMNYESLTYQRAVMRYLARQLSWLPLGAGFLVALFTRRIQALHDVLAQTFVLKI